MGFRRLVGSLVGTARTCIAIGLLLAPNAGAKVLIDDPLSGKTLGQLDGKGKFTSEGWETTGGKIIYYTDKPLASGAFEVEIKGFKTVPRMDKQPSKIEKAHIVGFSEGKSIKRKGEGNYIYIRVGHYEAYKLAVSSPVEDEHRRESRRGTAIRDADKWIHYRIVWDPKTGVDFLIDGKKIHTQDNRFPELEAFAIGNAGYKHVPGATYRNLKLESDAGSVSVAVVGVRSNAFQHQKKLVFGPKAGASELNPDAFILNLIGQRIPFEGAGALRVTIP